MPSIAELHDLKGFDWPKMPTVESVHIQNITYTNKVVEGDLVLKYELNGEHEAPSQFKTEIDQEQDTNLGPVVAKFHLWIDGPQLWLGLRLCIASFCTPEAQTSIALPH
jgi:hypothetical protein